MFSQIWVIQMCTDKNINSEGGKLLIFFENQLSVIFLNSEKGTQMPKGLDTGYLKKTEAF